jgi:hypothetical protein
MSLLDALVKRSSLTPRQIESLTSYVRVASGEIKLKEAASISSEGRKKGKSEQPLTIGSYYRTVSQGRKNIKQSLVTIVIALWLGMVRVEDVRRLFELVGSGTRDLPDQEAERFLQLLDALVGRIVV